MTTQHPDRAVWPSSTGDVPATAPGRVPALPPVPRTSTQTISARADRPSPQRQRSSTSAPGEGRRWAKPMVLALAALLAGAALGFGLHPHVMAPPRRTPAATAPSPPPGALFAQRQATVNRARLPTADLADFASPWLGAIADCSAEAISAAQRSNGETTRTRCTAGIVTSYWITYRTRADRDAAQARYRTQATTTPDLAASAAGPTQQRTTAGRTVQYIEYAYRIPSGDRAGQIVAAIWWSDPTTPMAGVFTGYWQDLGSTWIPLRDLWTTAAATPGQR